MEKENTTTTIRLAVTKHYRPPLDQQRAIAIPPTTSYKPLTPSTYKM